MNLLLICPYYFELMDLLLVWPYYLYKCVILLFKLMDLCIFILHAVTPAGTRNPPYRGFFRVPTAGWRNAPAYSLVRENSGKD